MPLTYIKEDSAGCTALLCIEHVFYWKYAFNQFLNLRNFNAHAIQINVYHINSLLISVVSLQTKTKTYSLNILADFLKIARNHHM